ncbi:MAG: ATP-binding protein [Spirochaetaceae bacterium]|nr:ATP-binding protein [Spirochaetaceae bacterium]
MIQNKDSIFGTIITLAEKLEGCKLEKDTLYNVREQVKKISDYLGTDEMAAIFFSVIFVIQNQRSAPVSMHEIAKYLDYSFLYILEYRREIDALEKKSLIYMDERQNVSHHPENNGYRITGTVINNVIEGEPVLQFEEAEKTTEQILEEIMFIQEAFMKNVMNAVEYRRQISKLETETAENEIIHNAVKYFANDIESRLMLYYFSNKQLQGKESIEPKRNVNRYETAVFDLLPKSSKSSRRKSMLEQTDTLITQGFLKRVSESTGEYLRGREQRFSTFCFTPEGFKKIFGTESDKYSLQDEVLTEMDKVFNFLSEFAYTLEDSDLTRYEKHKQLRDIEDCAKELTFVAKIKELIPKKEYRFFFYDCLNDFAKGYGTGLCRTLNDLYSHSNEYFLDLRAFLDEKHFLLTNDFLEIEKDEKVERTTLTVTDKTLNLLFGENADLYIKTTVAKNVLVPEDIKEKKLFYSEQVQKQISMLEESLEQKNLEAMQERLSQKGLCKGIAVILYGAPGTGKTETVYQLAKHTNRKIQHVDIADSKSMWFGESEKLIKKIFTDYKKLCKTCKSHHENTPILLFNEADALISKRLDVTGRGCAQTENAIQNILLEEMEKLEGIMIATTNLCDNMDKAFERRFLFKVKYEKPSIEARTNIWKSKLTVLNDEDAASLAGLFDFSGGEIDNIVRKCEMNEIIRGTQPSYKELVDLCHEERLHNEEERRMGFAL